MKDNTMDPLIHDQPSKKLKMPKLNPELGSKLKQWIPIVLVLIFFVYLLTTCDSTPSTYEKPPRLESTQVSYQEPVDNKSRYERKSSNKSKYAEVDSIIYSLRFIHKGLEITDINRKETKLKNLFENAIDKSIRSFMVSYQGKIVNEETLDTITLNDDFRKIFYRPNKE